MFSRLDSVDRLAGDAHPLPQLGLAPASFSPENTKKIVHFPSVFVVFFGWRLPREAQNRQHD